MNHNFIFICSCTASLLLATIGRNFKDIGISNLLAVRAKYIVIICNNLRIIESSGDLVWCHRCIVIYYFLLIIQCPNIIFLIIYLTSSVEIKISHYVFRCRYLFIATKIAAESFFSKINVCLFISI